MSALHEVHSLVGDLFAHCGVSLEEGAAWLLRPARSRMEISDFDLEHLGAVHCARLAAQALAYHTVSRLDQFMLSAGDASPLACVVAWDVLEWARVHAWVREVAPSVAPLFAQRRAWDPRDTQRPSMLLLAEGMAHEAASDYAKPLVSADRLVGRVLDATRDARKAFTTCLPVGEATQAHVERHERELTGKLREPSVWAPSPREAQLRCASFDALAQTEPVVELLDTVMRVEVGRCARAMQMVPEMRAVAERFSSYDEPFESTLGLVEVLRVQVPNRSVEEDPTDRDVRRASKLMESLISRTRIHATRVKVERPSAKVPHPHPLFSVRGRQSAPTA